MRLLFFIFAFLLLPPVAGATAGLASSSGLSHNERVSRLLEVSSGVPSSDRRPNSIASASTSASRDPISAVSIASFLTLFFTVLYWGLRFFIWRQEIHAAEQQPATPRRVYRITDREPAWARAIKTRAVSAAPKSKNFKKSKSK